MSFECLKCGEVWNYEDYVCPCCGSCAVDTNSKIPLTLKYKFYEESGEYDVIRLSSGKSVFDEEDNYLNKEE
jgi:hypothetical protein